MLIVLYFIFSYYVCQLFYDIFVTDCLIDTDCPSWMACMPGKKSVNGTVHKVEVHTCENPCSDNFCNNYGLQYECKVINHKAQCVPIKGRIAEPGRITEF